MGRQVQDKRYQFLNYDFLVRDKPHAHSLFCQSGLVIPAACCCALTDEQMLCRITSGQFSWHLDETRFGSP